MWSLGVAGFVKAMCWRPWFTSGNRDEAVFPDPETFDLDRPKRDLLTFGRGPHQCPGAPLARLQLEVATREIVNRTRRLRLAGDIQMTNWPEYGPLAVPVVIES